MRKIIQYFACIGKRDAEEVFLIIKRNFSSQKACALKKFMYICKRQQASAYETTFGVDMFTRVSCRDLLRQEEDG